MNENQRGRRNLTTAWLIELELGNKSDLLEIGKKTQGRRTDLLSENDKKLESPPSVNTRKEIAKAAGVSTGQVGKRKFVSLTSVRFLLELIHASADLPEIIHGAWRLVWPEPSGNCIFAQTPRRRDHRPGETLCRTCADWPTVEAQNSTQRPGRTATHSQANFQTMIDIIHSAIITFNHYRESRRVRRACRMSFAELQNAYDHIKANGGFSRIGETPTINQGTVGIAHHVPQSDSSNIETINH
jgi:hypothetical protein